MVSVGRARLGTGPAGDRHYVMPTAKRTTTSTLTDAQDAARKIFHEAANAWPAVRRFYATKRKHFAVIERLDPTCFADFLAWLFLLDQDCYLARSVESIVVIPREECWGEMGYSLSWIAVRGKSPESVLAQLKLAPSGRFEETPGAPLSAATLPSGWFIVIANDCNYADRSPLKELSRDAEVVACAVEEHVMASGASCYVDGKEQWCIAHDSERGLNHLDISGDPPQGTRAIRKRAEAQQKADGADEAEVDYLCEVAIELAAELTGFRHDRSAPAIRFETLKKKAARPRDNPTMQRTGPAVKVSAGRKPRARRPGR